MQDQSQSATSNQPTEAVPQDSDSWRLDLLASLAIADFEANGNILVPDTQKLRDALLSEPEPSNNSSFDINAADQDDPAEAEENVKAAGIQPTDPELLDTLRPDALESTEMTSSVNSRSAIKRLLGKFDFFDSLLCHPELLMEIAKHLPPKEFLFLYSISKAFHQIVNGHLSHVMKATAAYQAPESARIFIFKLYGPLCVRDPVGRETAPGSGDIRMTPSIRWLKMVVHREKTVRDILACMARQGLRMPRTMSLSLKKMWLTMDIATSNRRVQLLHNEEYWSDADIYNVQMFVMKLDMRFNDPIDGPADDGLRKLMLGQRGLTPLAQLLRRTRFTDETEVLEAALRYAYEKPHPNLPILGIPPEEIGVGHLEGWGAGRVHLYRLDEMVMREAVRRNLHLDKHMLAMMLWGYADPETKLPIAVSAEERYMSDDDDDDDVENNRYIDLEADMDDDDDDMGGMREESDESPENMGRPFDEEWETEDEDMGDDGNIENDDADAAAYGPSGFRRVPEEED